MWLDVEILMMKFNTEQINFGTNTVIANLLVENPKNVKNFICLLLKQFMYRQRCLGLGLEYIVKYIATKNNRLLQHQKKWGDYSPSTGYVDATQTDAFVHEYICNM